MSNLQVANTIRQQISIMTMMACGARTFVGDSTSIRFQVGDSRKGLHVRVSLNDRDLYDIKLMQYNRKSASFKILKYLEDAYCDMLSEVIYDMVNKP